MKIITSRKKAFSLVALFLVIITAPVFSFILKTGALSQGVDDNTLGCTGLGDDYSSDNISSWNSSIGPGDFEIIVVDRATLLIKTTSPSKSFFTTGGVTLGDVFGTNGCTIIDGNLDDGGNPKTVWENDDSIASVDAIYYDGNYNDTVNRIEKSLGPVDISKIQSFGLTLVIRTEDTIDGANMVLDSDGWSKRGTVNTDDGEPMRITNISSKDNYNVTLKAVESGDEIEIVSSDGQYDFSQGTLNGQVIFADNLSNLSEDFMVLGSNSIEQLRSANSLLSLEYFNDEGDSQGFVNVAPSSLVAQINSTTGADSAGVEASESRDTNDSTCEGESGAFGFIMCPSLRLANEGFERFDKYIYSSLSIDRTFIVGDVEEQQIRDVWRSFRDISYIVLIPIMLVMVIGTALNFQIFDAYTVKRALPRMLVSIMFITLSFNLCVLMIDIVNTIGAGVGGLVAQPWGGVEELQLTNVFGGNAERDGGAGETTASVVLLGGLAFYALSGVTTIGLLITVGLAFITILIIFAILALRELVIVFLVIVAPLAIIAWIFPGNDKPWKLWWLTFSKLLMLYPIIIGLIMLGRGFAKTIESTGQDDVLFVTTLIKIAAYVGPYFFIPKAFQLAGSAFGNLAGVINDRSKGVFDRGRKRRAEATAEARQKNKNFSRFSDSNKLGRGVNSILGATGGWQGAKSMRSADTFRAARDAGQRNQGMENLKRDPTWPEIENNDAALAALADMEFAEKKLAKAQASFAAAQAAGDADGMRSAQAEIENRQKGIALAKQVGTRNTSATRRAALAQLAKTGYQFSAGKNGYDELEAIADSIAGSDAGLRSNIMNEAQYHLKNAGRFDLAGINHGAGYDSAGGLSKASLYALGNGKKESITTMGEDALRAGVGVESLTAYKELKATLPGANAGNQKEILKQIAAIEGMYNQHIDPATGDYTSIEEFSRKKSPSVGGRTTQRTVRTAYDSTLALSDAAYDAQFTTADKHRGYREDVVTVPVPDESLGEIAEKRARVYERPDPNNIDN